MRFSTTRTGPWFMIGYFNENTAHNEKEGGRQRLDTSFLPFKQIVGCWSFHLLEHVILGREESMKNNC